MATIRPFKAYRPAPGVCDRVAALPYDVMTSEEAREMVKDNPYSFLHIDRAEIDLPIGTPIYSDEVYQKASDNLNKMIENKIFICDNKPCLYIYRLTMDGASQTGIAACTSIDEYLDGTIKKHELTRESKEQDRIRHVDACNANTGPIFLTYKAKAEIDRTVDEWTLNNTPVYDFVAEDGISHTVWVIDDENTISALCESFKAVPYLYIADGHHRNASAVKVGLKRRGKGEYDKNAEFNYYLSVLFPDDELRIMDYNRVIKDLNGLDEESFFARVKENFDIEEKSCKFKPFKPHTFGMYINSKWYCLTAKPQIIPTDSVGELDVSILQNSLLTPILNIGDPRVDKRIDFVGGIRGLEELEALVDSGKMKLAFAMFPTSMAELMSVADDNKIMPPKSTWFEPKLRSGIFIHRLS